MNFYYFQVVNYGEWSRSMGRSMGTVLMLLFKGKRGDGSHASVCGLIVYYGSIQIERSCPKDSYYR